MEDKEKLTPAFPHGLMREIKLIAMYEEVDRFGNGIKLPSVTFYLDGNSVGSSENPYLINKYFRGCMSEDTYRKDFFANTYYFHDEKY